MSAPPTYIFDGFTTQSDGVNDGRAGSLLPPSQAQLLVNGTCRGDYISQRPGFELVTRVAGPTAGFFQHGSQFVARASGRQYLIAVIGGYFYRTDPQTGVTLDITISGDRNSAVLERGWSVQAEDFWIYNDGQSPVFIHDGANSRRARNGELRPGTVLAYIQGRVIYASPDGFAFRIADLVGNPTSGTPAYNYRDSVLRETENTYLNEGGEFAVPQDSGGITAIRASTQLDVSQGQGPAQVACRRTIFSFNAPVDRTTWKDLTYPIVTTSLPGNGFECQQGTALVNGDIIGRSDDGIRSFVIARRDFRQPGNSPQSYEVSTLLDADALSLLQFASCGVTDNRFLSTLSPGFSQRGVYHRGLVAMDLLPVASIQQQGTPNYDGVWTGLNILAVVPTPDGNVYLYALASDGGVDLWRVTRDNLYDNEDGRIQWSVVPRTLFVERDAAGRPLWHQKRLETGDLFYDQLAGPVQFTISWRPDAYPCFTLWQTWSECAPVCPEALGCTPPLSFSRQYRDRFRLHEPDDVCAQGTHGLPLRNFYQLDVRLDVTGPARIRGFRIGASRQDEPTHEPTCATDPCLNLNCCENPVFGYQAKESSWIYYRDYYGYQSWISVGQNYSYNQGGTGGTVGHGVGGVGGTADEGTVLPDVPGTPGDPLALPTFPNPAPLGCNLYFTPTFEEHGDPTDVRQMGMDQDPGVSPITAQQLADWAVATWAKFSEFATANGLVVSRAQLVWAWDNAQPGGGYFRWNALQYFTVPAPLFDIPSYGMGWNLQVEYCL